MVVKLEYKYPNSDTVIEEIYNINPSITQQYLKNINGVTTTQNVFVYPTIKDNFNNVDVFYMITLNLPHTKEITNFLLSWSKNDITVASMDISHIEKKYKNCKIYRYKISPEQISISLISTEVTISELNEDAVNNIKNISTNHVIPGHIKLYKFGNKFLHLDEYMSDSFSYDDLDDKYYKETEYIDATNVKLFEITNKDVSEKYKIYTFDSSNQKDILRLSYGKSEFFTYETHKFPIADPIIKNVGYTEYYIEFGISKSIEKLIGYIEIIDKQSGEVVSRIFSNKTTLKLYPKEYILRYIAYHPLFSNHVIKNTVDISTITMGDTVGDDVYFEKSLNFTVEDLREICDFKCSETDSSGNIIEYTQNRIIEVGDEFKFTPKKNIIIKIDGYNDFICNKNTEFSITFDNPGVFDLEIYDKDTYINLGKITVEVLGEYTKTNYYNLIFENPPIAKQYCKIIINNYGGNLSNISFSSNVEVIKKLDDSNYIIMFKNPGLEKIEVYNNGEKLFEKYVFVNSGYVFNHSFENNILKFTPIEDGFLEYEDIIYRLKKGTEIEIPIFNTGINKLNIRYILSDRNKFNVEILFNNENLIYKFVKNRRTIKLLANNPKNIRWFVNNNFVSYGDIDFIVPIEYNKCNVMCKFYINDKEYSASTDITAYDSYYVSMEGDILKDNYCGYQIGNVRYILKTEVLNNNVVEFEYPDNKFIISGNDILHFVDENIFVCGSIDFSVY